MPNSRARRQQQLQKMTKEAIVAAWMVATKKAASPTGKNVQRLIAEVLEAEYPSKASSKLNEPTDKT